MKITVTNERLRLYSTIQATLSSALRMVLKVISMALVLWPFGIVWVRVDNEMKALSRKLGAEN